MLWESGQWSDQEITSELPVGRNCGRRPNRRRSSHFSTEIRRDLLSEVLHFLPAGTRRLSSSNQFSTALICVGAASPASVGFDHEETLAIRRHVVIGPRSPGAARSVPQRSPGALPAVKLGCVAMSTVIILSPLRYNSSRPLRFHTGSVPLPSKFATSGRSPDRGARRLPAGLIHSRH